MKCRIVFETPRSGAVSVRYGRLLSPAEFKNAVELFVECGEVNLKPGGGSTIVTAGEFSFFLRDVNSGYPVYVPDDDFLVNVNAARLACRQLGVKDTDFYQAIADFTLSLKQ